MSRTSQSSRSDSEPPHAGPASRPAEIFRAHGQASMIHYLAVGRTVLTNARTGPGRALRHPLLHPSPTRLPWAEAVALAVDWQEGAWRLLFASYEIWVRPDFTDSPAGMSLVPTGRSPGRLPACCVSRPGCTPPHAGSSRNRPTRPARSCYRPRRPGRTSTGPHPGQDRAEDRSSFLGQFRTDGST